MAELYTPITWTSIHAAITPTGAVPTTNVYVPSVITPSYREQYIQENYPTTLATGYKQAAGVEINPIFRALASGTSYVAESIRRGIPEVSARLAPVPIVGSPLAYATPFTSETVAGTIEGLGMVPGGRQVLYERPWILPTAVEYGVGETIRSYQEAKPEQLISDIAVSSLLFGGVGRALRRSKVVAPSIMGEYEVLTPKQSARLFRGLRLELEPSKAFIETFDPMKRITEWGVRAQKLRMFPLAYKPSAAFVQAFTSKVRTFPELEPGYVWKRATGQEVIRKGTYFEVKPEFIRGRTTFPELEPGYVRKYVAPEYKPPPSYFKEPKAGGISKEWYSELGQEVYKTFSKYRPKGTFIKEAGLGDIPSYFIGKKLSPEEIRAQRAQYRPTFFRVAKGKAISLKEMLLVTQEQKLMPVGKQLRGAITGGRTEIYKAMTKRVPEVAETVKRTLPKRYTIEGYLKQQVQIGKLRQELMQRITGKQRFTQRPVMRSRMRFLSGLVPVMRFRTETGLGIKDITASASRQTFRMGQSITQRLDTSQISKQIQRDTSALIPRITFPTPTIPKPITTYKPERPPTKPPTYPPTVKPPTFRLPKPKKIRPSRGLPESDYGRRIGLMGFGKFGELARIKSAREILRGL